MGITSFPPGPMRTVIRLNNASCLLKNDPIVLKSCIAFAILFIAVLFVNVAPVTATDTGGIILPDYHHIDISMANGGTNYIKFDGGGLNALHITTTTSEAYGQVTNTEEPSGTFYLSDTGGRGFSDDLILMVAVKTEVPDDYKIHIKASGYTWAPTPILNQPPTASEITYLQSSVDDTFTKEDFIYGPQAWKPMNGEPYPIVSGQDMTDPSEVYRFMFVDLHAGLLGPNSNLSGLIDNGMIKVQYSITNPAGLTVFNTYAWCNQSNQGKGISWTNALDENVGNGGKTTGGSGFSVKGSSSPGQGGDTATPGAPVGSVSMDETRNPGEQSGFEGKTSGFLTPVTLNGSAFLVPTNSPEVNLTPGKSTEFVLDTGDLQGAAIDNARFWLFVSGSRSIATGSGADPDFSLVFDGKAVSPEAVFRDNAGYSTAPESVTLCYDVKPALKNSAAHTIRATFNGPPDSGCTVKGGTLLVLARDETKKQLICWIDEDCDIISADPGNGIQVDDPVTRYPFDGIVTPAGSMANLSLVSTPGGPEPAMETATFNLGEWQAASHARLPPVQIRSLNATPFLSGSGNRATSQDLNTGAKGSFLENRVAILVVTKEALQGSSPLRENITDGDTATQRVIQSPLTTIVTSTVPTAVRQTVSPRSLQPGESRHLLPGPFAFIEDLLVGLFGLSGTTVTGPDSEVSPVVQNTITPAVDSSSPARPGDARWNLSIVTNPSGASVIVDGSVVSGSTPLTVPGLPGGGHSVGVQKMGFSQMDITVRLDRDQEISVNLTPDVQVNGSIPGVQEINARPPTNVPVAIMPQGKLGGVYVDSNPNGATIHIDGLKTNLITPAVVSGIREGLHTISVKKESVTYPKNSQSIRIFPEAVVIALFNTNQAPSRMISFEAPDFPGATITVNGRGPELKTSG